MVPNVGIGTTAPLGILHVAGSYGSLRYEGPANTNRLAFYNGAGNQQTWFDGNTTLNTAEIKTFASRLTLGASGDTLNIVGSNVGIGTTSPNVPLQVNSNINTTALALTANNYSAGGQRLSMDFNYAGGTHTYSQISNYTDSVVTWGGALAFSTNAGTTQGSPLVERMRINASGNVGIGTTAPNNGLTIAKDNAGLGLQLKTDTFHNEIGFKNAAGTLVADILSSVSTTTYGTQNGGLGFFTGSSFAAPRLLMDSNGNFGIGTTDL